MQQSYVLHSSKSCRTSRAHHTKMFRSHRSRPVTSWEDSKCGSGGLKVVFVSDLDPLFTAYTTPFPARTPTVSQHHHHLVCEVLAKAPGTMLPEVRWLASQLLEQHVTCKPCTGACPAVLWEHAVWHAGLCRGGANSAAPASSRSHAAMARQPRPPHRAAKAWAFLAAHWTRMRAF